MSYKIEFHSDVYEDYREAYEWYERNKEGLGDRFTTRKSIPARNTANKNFK